MVNIFLTFLLSYTSNKVGTGFYLTVSKYSAWPLVLFCIAGGKNHVRSRIFKTDKQRGACTNVTHLY